MFPFSYHLYHFVRATCLGINFTICVHHRCHTISTHTGFPLFCIKSGKVGEDMRRKKRKKEAAGRQENGMMFSLRTPFCHACRALFCTAHHPTCTTATCLALDSLPYTAHLYTHTTATCSTCLHLHCLTTIPATAMPHYVILPHTHLFPLHLHTPAPRAFTVPYCMRSTYTHCLPATTVPFCTWTGSAVHTCCLHTWTCHLLRAHLPPTSCILPFQFYALYTHTHMVCLDLHAIHT